MWMIERSLLKGAMVAVAAGAGLLLASPSDIGAISIFTAQLDSVQEVQTPPVVSPATGFGTVVLNDAQNRITVNLSFSGLLAEQTEAHIHGPAAPGSNAPIIIPLPLGQITNLDLPISSAHAGFLNADLTYFNVHTALFPAGEIRGQINLIPEPGTILLLGGGLVGIAAWRRLGRKRTVTS
jgi:hypothetical protein